MAAKKSKLRSADPLVVVSIDFGTTLTGFAFSFSHDKQKIYTSNCRGKLPKERVPTTVLFNPDKSFNSFGFEADANYAKFIEKEEHSNYFYFKRFKMALYLTQKITRDVTINDSEGRPMCAMDVFQTVIENLKNYASSAIKESLSKIDDHDIQWILTVPAIWSDSAKQFMREAALQAGIDENQLNLVLEPEAASLYCKEQPHMKIINRDQSSAAGKFERGHKYIIADLGGGTADICVHQIVADGNLRELYRATGDALGANCVDNAFQLFLVELIGADSLMAFKQEYMEEYLEFMKSFEVRKSGFSSLKKTEVRLTIPADLIVIVEENMKQTLAEIIPETKYANTVSIHKRNKLLINYEVMEGFFKPTVQGIVKLLNEILDEIENENIQTLLMVGGFSESPYLGEIVQSEIKVESVIFQPDGSLAVLKGAVMMGYRPKTIVERKARFSYGIAGPQDIHYDRWKFKKLISKGEILSYGQVITWYNQRTYETRESKQQVSLTSLYKSTKSDPSFISEEGCTEEGKITMNPPLEGWSDNVQEEYRLIVGQTEFNVEMFYRKTRAQCKAKLEFL